MPTTLSIRSLSRLKNSAALRSFLWLALDRGVRLALAVGVGSLGLYVQIVDLIERESQFLGRLEPIQTLQSLCREYPEVAPTVDWMR